MHKGFTLVEMTVVIIIIGLLLAGLLGPIRTQIEARDRKQGLEQLELIKEAVFGYTLSNNFLPCPDDTGDGVQDRTSGDCDSSQGNIPWVDLGVDQFDPWGRAYQMRVDTAFANQPTPPASVAFGLTSDGSIEVRDKPSGGDCDAGAPGGNQVADNVPLVVYSQGNKLVGNEPLSCYEQENIDNNDEFVFRQFNQHQSNTPANPASNYFFDDLVIWISPNVLKNKMVQAGRLP